MNGRHPAVVGSVAIAMVLGGVGLGELSAMSESARTHSAAESAPTGTTPRPSQATPTSPTRSVTSSRTGTHSEDLNGRPRAIPKPTPKQQIPCPEPTDPFAGAKKTVVFQAPGVQVIEYTKPGRTPLYLTIGNIGEDGPKVDGGPVMGNSVSEIGTLFSKVALRKPLVATNGDFFEYGKDGSPIGQEVLVGGRVAAGTSRQQEAIIENTDRTVHIGAGWLKISLQGSAGATNGTAWNNDYFPDNAISVFTPGWGSKPRSNLSPTETLRELVVSSHHVVAVHDGITDTPVPPDGEIIIAQGGGIDRLAAAGVSQVGARVTVHAVAQSVSESPVSSEIGGGIGLISKGRYLGPVCSVDHPLARTIVGTFPGGRKMFVAVVQGQTDAAHQNFSGLTLQESTAFARGLGATDSVMFDGGGSATVISRTPSGQQKQYTLSPDGWNRHIPNGFGFWSATR